MELVRARSGASAAFYDERWSSKVRNQVTELGPDITCIKINEDGLHLQHFGCAGLSLLCDSAGDHIHGGALAPRPLGEGRELVERGGVCVDPDIVGLAIPALALVDKATDGDHALAIAEHDVEESADLGRIRFYAERIFRRSDVIEIPPGIKMEDIFLCGFCFRWHIVGHDQFFQLLWMVGGRWTRRSGWQAPAAACPRAHAAFEEVAVASDAR